MAIQQLQPFLNFDGRCEEAVEFYRRVLGAEVDTLMRVSDSPEAGNCGAGEGEKIMHTSFRIGQTVVMASDCRSTGKPVFQGISLALSITDEAEVDRLCAALAEGGEVEVPPAQTFWSPRFAVVNDRFGVSWMLNAVTPEK